MTPRDLATETASALDANRGRSLLTVLGIVIGIAAVIAMTSLIGGVRNSLVGSLGLDAARRISMFAANPLSRDDLDTLQQTLPDYELIAGSYIANGAASAEKGEITATVTGANTDYLRATGVKATRGRLWTADEMDQGAQVCLVTADVMRQLFGDAEADPAGKSLTLGGRSFSVVGVVEDSLMTSNGEGFGSLWVPEKTAKNLLDVGAHGYNDIVGLAREDADVDALAERTASQIARMQGVPEEERDNLVYVSTMKAAIDSMNAYMNSFSLIMGSVASISLVVGGIGIMNMMLTNVTERIREIGLRRALGATRRDITTQFLCESVAISLAGGVLGTALGLGGAWALARLASTSGLMASMGGSAQLVPAVSLGAVGMASGICVLIGLVFGYYPARRAARLDPVEALRYQ